MPIRGAAVLMLLLGGLLGPAACGSESEEGEAPDRPARTAPDIGEYPEELQTAIGRGIALLQNDRIQEAIAHFDRTAERFPDRGIAHHYLAMAYSQVEQVNRALEAWERAEALGYDSAELRQGRARAYRVLKQFEPALEEIEIALELEPDSLEYAYWRAFTLYKLQRFEESEAAFEELVRRAPKQSRAWMQLGRSRLARYDPDGALQAFRRVLALDSGHEGARLEIATLLGRQGDWSGVVQTLEPLDRGRTASSQVHFKLSTAYQRLGRADLAQRHRELHEQLREQEREEKRRKAQQHQPFFEAGRAALGREDWDAAIERFERILEIEPDNAEARELLEEARRRRDEKGR